MSNKKSNNNNNNNNNEIMKGSIFIFIGTVILLISLFIPDSSNICMSTFKIFSPQTLSILMLVVGMVFMMFGLILIRIEYTEKDRRANNEI